MFRPRSFSPHQIVYWLAWLAVFTYLFYQKLTILQNASRAELRQFFDPVLGVISLGTLVVIVIENWRFRSYLEQHHHKKSNMILSIGKNTKTLFHYLASKDKFPDQQLNRLKNDLLNAYLFALIVFLSNFVLFK